mgnify:CR=1 FL=1
MKYFIDLDDTLVNSTILNNDAYNFALEQYGFDRIVTKERLTRDLLVGYKNLDKIIKLKQKYFTLEWLPYRLILNKELLSKLNKFGKLNCFLWTKADKTRANKIVESCNLNLPYSFAFCLRLLMIYIQKKMRDLRASLLKVVA